MLVLLDRNWGSALGPGWGAGDWGVDAKTIKTHSDMQKLQLFTLLSELHYLGSSTPQTLCTIKLGMHMALL